MTKEATQEWVGIFIILSHFALVGLILVSFLMGGFVYEQFTTTAALVIPLFAASTATIVSGLARSRSRSRTAGVRPAFVFVAFLVPAALTLYLATVILAFSFNYLQNFEQLKGLIAVGETAYATYLGRVVRALFGR
jgi:hypothetical protein